MNSCTTAKQLPAYNKKEQHTDWPATVPCTSSRLEYWLSGLQSPKGQQTNPTRSSTAPAGMIVNQVDNLSDDQIESSKFLKWTTDDASPHPVWESFFTVECYEQSYGPIPSFQSTVHPSAHPSKRATKRSPCRLVGAHAIMRHQHNRMMSAQTAAMALTNTHTECGWMRAAYQIHHVPQPLS